MGAQAQEKTERVVAVRGVILNSTSKHAFCPGEVGLCNTMDERSGQTQYVKEYKQR